MHKTRLHGRDQHGSVRERPSEDPPSSMSNVGQAGQNRPTADSQDPVALIRTLARARKNVKLVRVIPRGVREACAVAYAQALADFNSRRDYDAWQKLITLPTLMLHIPARKANDHSLCQLIRRNLEEIRGRDLEGLIESCPRTPPPHGSKSNGDREIALQAERKLAEGDVRSAARTLLSTDSFAPLNDLTEHKLRSKHPQPTEAASTRLRTLQAPGEAETCLIQGPLIVEAVRSFALASGPGLDGLRPRHLRDMLDNTIPSSGRLLEELCTLVSTALKGGLPPFCQPVFYGANLTALKKKDGSIRPIACGLTIRRLVAKVALAISRRSIIRAVAPKQVGVCIKGGAEAAVHAARAFVDAEGPARVLVKLDFRNAFNTIRRDVVLEEVGLKVPELLPIVWQSYKEPSLLSWSEREPFSSASGVQQGDPLGPALFSLGISGLVARMSSPLNVWYLDDGTLGGPADLVAEDILKVLQFEDEGGLALNATKCEIITVGGNLQEQEEMHRIIAEVLPGAKRVEPADSELLGAPIGARRIPQILAEKRNALLRVLPRLTAMHPQAALCLWRYSLGSPKFNYTLRTSPTSRYADELREYDSVSKDILGEVLNIDVTEITWQRASLPIKEGGLGIRAATELAPICYAASLLDFGQLAETLVEQDVRQQIRKAREEAELTARLMMDPGPWEERPSQHTLDGYRCKVITRDIVARLESPRETATFLAARDAFSGGFLRALPSPQLGTMLENTSFRMVAALRIGAPICEPYTCKACGSTVDKDGLHPLSCTKSPGRASRHAELNAVIKRALRKAGIPSTLEPRLGLGDGKRPDGVTIQPWSKGKCLVWDATVSCTVAPSYIRHSATEVGWVAEHAEAEKKRKYAELEARYIFVPIAMETMGPVSRGTDRFITDLGARIEANTADRREGEFLRQMLSLAVCRGNAASIMGTME